MLKHALDCNSDFRERLGTRLGKILAYKGTQHLMSIAVPLSTYPQTHTCTERARERSSTLLANVMGYIANNVKNSFYDMTSTTNICRLVIAMAPRFFV